MTKSIWLTRSTAENQVLINKLRKYNFLLIDSPLIMYSNVDFDANILKKYSNIIITSKYAANILVDTSFRCNFKHLSAWVVGKISAEILASIDINVKFIARNVAELVDNIPENTYNSSIYLSSNEITKPLPSKITRYIIYNVKYINQIDQQTTSAINKGIDYILLYSQNCAKTLINLLVEQNLINLLLNTTVITISDKVAKEILPYFKTVLYCDKGRTNQIIELLITHAISTSKE